MIDYLDYRPLKELIGVLITLVLGGYVFTWMMSLNINRRLKETLKEHKDDMVKAIDETKKAIDRLPCPSQAEKVSKHGERLARLEAAANGTAKKICPGEGG